MNKQLPQFAVSIILLSWIFFTSVRLLFTPWYIDLIYQILPTSSAQTPVSVEKTALAKQVIFYLTHHRANLVLYTLDPPGELGITIAEQKHLQDVKKLVVPSLRFQALLSVTSLILLGVLVQKNHWGLLKKVSGKVLRFTQVTFLLMIVVTVFAWNAFFTLFHQLLFPQGNWAFPFDSFLITVFPEIFWVCSSVVLIGLPVIIAWFIHQVISRISANHEASKR